MADTKLTNNGDEIIIDDFDLGDDYTEVADDSTTKQDDSEQGDKKNDEETVTISKSKLILIKKILTNIKTSNDQLTKLLSSTIDAEEEERISIAQVGDNSFNLNNTAAPVDDGRIIEGIFDGESMIGPDGKQYSVPANYASKSKLIEGDALKLTITNKGTFVYKQIKPIERRRVIGILQQESSGNFIVVADNNKWHVLTASVTYYKGQTGDEVVVIVPMNSKSKWAAVDNVVKNAAV